MSKFYGRVQGQGKSEATRTGGKSSGIGTSAETWTRCVKVEVYVADNGNEVAEVFITDKHGNRLRTLYHGVLDDVVREEVAS